jgi:hypothetical protein
LVERGFISQERPLDQPFSGFPQGNEVDLQEAGDAVVMVETESMAVRDGDQEKVEQDLQGGEVQKESTGDQAVIDPAEGAIDFSDSLGTEESFEGHGPNLLVSIGP